MSVCLSSKIGKNYRVFALGKKLNDRYPGHREMNILRDVSYFISKYEEIRYKITRKLFTFLENILSLLLIYLVNY